MIITNQDVKFASGVIYGDEMVRNIAMAGKVCYRTETIVSAENFVKKLIERGHESVLEHEKLSVKLTTDRAIANELVRHRHCAFSQESTRYVNFGKKHMYFIKPNWATVALVDGQYKGLTVSSNVWVQHCLDSEFRYIQLIEQGARPEDARAVLPLSLATTLVMTANLREWRSIFKLRCDEHAHPMVRQLMCMTLDLFYRNVPAVYDDLHKEYCE